MDEIDETNDNPFGQNDFEMRNVGRNNSIPMQKRGRRKKRGKNMKKKRKKKKDKEEKKEFDEEPDPTITDPIKKLQRAHPRHVVKLILKKLAEKPQFYRMLGSLGVALKSSGINLYEYLLSSSNHLPKSTRGKMRYDINDHRMLILARLAIHKMLIREGTRLKSAIHRNGTYPEDIDSDNDIEHLDSFPKTYQNLKKSLKYISNDKVAEAMQQEEPQDILDALSFADKHKLYQLFKSDLFNTDENEGGPTQLHKLCTAHVSKPPELMPSVDVATALKYDEEDAWPSIPQAQNIRMSPIADDILSVSSMDIHEAQMPGSSSSTRTMNVVNGSMGGSLSSVPPLPFGGSTFSVPSAKSIYEAGEESNLSDYQFHEKDAEREEEKNNATMVKYRTIAEDTEDMIRKVKNNDEARMMADSYQYEEVFDDHDHDDGAVLDENGSSSSAKDMSLLSSLQTQIDILVRYNHIGYKHLNMMLYDKSCLPEMYVSLERMIEWELERENEIEILETKRAQCKERYGWDIDELNMRKALLAREINETKVSLERIKYSLESMKKLYENAKIQLDEVNDVIRHQEMNRDAYLTKFDEKWTFEWPARAQFHRQTKLNENIKMDAKHWSNKLDEIKRYHDSQEVWDNLKEELWKFGNDNKKISEHYLNLNCVNTSREAIYFGCVEFWNRWYMKHCTTLNHEDDQQKLSTFYKDILLKGTARNEYFDVARDSAIFEHVARDSDASHAWSYRDYIYDKQEAQIDIRQTELPIQELWRLVHYQENGDYDSYRRYAYPKIWQWEQEQLEMERKERVKDIEKKQHKKLQKRLSNNKHAHTAARNMTATATLSNLVTSGTKILKLQEGDETDEDEDDKKYEDQLKFVNRLESAGTEQLLSSSQTQSTLMGGFRDTQSSFKGFGDTQSTLMGIQSGTQSSIGFNGLSAFGGTGKGTMSAVQPLMMSGVGRRSRNNTMGQAPYLAGLHNRNESGAMTHRQESVQSNVFSKYSAFSSPRNTGRKSMSRFNPETPYTYQPRSGRSVSRFNQETPGAFFNQGSVAGSFSNVRGVNRMGSNSTFAAQDSVASFAKIVPQSFNLKHDNI